jgi:hypothetical protein
MPAALAEGVFHDFSSLATCLPPGASERDLHRGSPIGPSSRVSWNIIVEPRLA